VETGVKAEDIKAGVRPDYVKLRDKLVVIRCRGRFRSSACGRQYRGAG